MGIDMYAFKFEPKRAKGIFAVDHDGFTQEDWENRRIHTWRSHSALDSLMHQLFKHKGGKGTCNCCFPQLSLEALRLAEKVIRSGRFEQEVDNYCCFYKNWVAKDLAFIEKARKYIKDGYCVYYSNWW